MANVATDTYEIGGDTIPSVKGVPGEHTLNYCAIGAMGDGTLYQTRSYLLDANQGLDMGANPVRG